MSSIYSIGLSGLNAAQVAISTVAQNVSNVNTPGYHRQRVSQAAQMPSFQGYGYVGRGVEMTAVNRVYNSYLERQLSTATTQESKLSTQMAYLSQLEDLLGDESTSLGSSMSDLFKSMQALNSTPDSIPARQAVINSAQAFAGRVQLVNGRFEELREGINTQIRSSVSQVNAIGKQISEINVQIQSMGQGGAVPNDLMDKRDQLVLDLNRLVKADVTVQSDGRYTISIGSGQALVSSGDHFPLEVVESLNDPQKLEIAYAGSNGTVRIPDRLFEGGSLSGLINSKAEALNRSQADLGRLVMEVADQLNRQSGVGRDLYNQPGGDIFKSLSNFRPVAVGELNPRTGEVETLESQMKAYRDAAANFSVAITDPSKLAVSSSLKASLPHEGVLKPTISSVWQTAQGSHDDAVPSLPADIELKYTPNGKPPFSAAGYDVTDAPGVAGGYILTSQTDPALVIEFKAEGMGDAEATLTISTKASGLDTPEGKADFTPSDNSNMLELVKIQTKKTMSSTPNGTANFQPDGTVGKTTDFQGFFGQLVSFIGTKTNEVKIASEAQAVTLKETYLARESFSGVNLDEEAANLIRFQQAYQASSKII
ncbi:flagellar hook-associated protein FlgK, partial [Craterilacuibacter sp.]|uniref:flagellar hook-associated protein FlgK n=1 Tax=Craterilacuibacter sp. TaxID=2870909 RepID=UPI003F30E88A